MRITISGRKMEVTDALREHIETGLAKVRTHFDKIIDANVVLAVEKRRHIAEVTLLANGIRIHGKEESDDMYASVDAVVLKLDKQVRRFKGRINRYQPRKGKEEMLYGHNLIQLDRDGVEEHEEEVQHRVILREKLPMKPMSVEEATMQLELASDRFLVFSNADTQQVNVLYSHGDGTYGLIEPQF